MKRKTTCGDGDGYESRMAKKVKVTSNEAVDAVLLDENLLYEVLKHVEDARTLASAACVSKQWTRTAQDERLWEMICTKHTAGRHHPLLLRSMVLKLGGFRCLFSGHLWPLVKPSSSSSAPQASTWPCLPPAPARSGAGKTRWGKDEVNLSLSLLSISYFGQMNFKNRGK